MTLPDPLWPWLVGALGIAALPALVFYCVKLGTYAFYRGRQVFLDEQGKTNNGEIRGEG